MYYKKKMSLVFMLLFAYVLLITSAVCNDQEIEKIEIKKCRRVHSPDGMKIAVLSTNKDEKISIGCAKKLKTLGNIGSSGSTIKNMVWSPDGSRMALSYASKKDCCIEIWCTKTYRCLCSINNKHPINGIIWGFDGKTLAYSLRISDKTIHMHILKEVSNCFGKQKWKRQSVVENIKAL